MATVNDALSHLKRERDRLDGLVAVAESAAKYGSIENAITEAQNRLDKLARDEVDAIAARDAREEHEAKEEKDALKAIEKARAKGQSIIDAAEEQAKARRAEGDRYITDANDKAREIEAEAKKRAAETEARAAKTLESLAEESKKERVGLDALLADVSVAQNRLDAILGAIERAKKAVFGLGKG